MDSLIVREYQTEDIEAMFALDCLCFAEVFRFSRRAMRRFAEAHGAVSLLAVAEEGKMAGFVIAHVESTGRERYGYVVTLDVAPEWRRAGLGVSLMREAEQRLANTGVQVIALHVFVENEAAVEFYEQAGYTRVGLEAGFYGVGLGAWVYSKHL